MDIVLTADGTCTLVDIIIINVIHVDLVSRITFSKGMAARITTQAKTMSYRNQYHENDFILLTIEIFGCLH
jgi:general stress protein CsbA